MVGHPVTRAVADLPQPGAPLAHARAEVVVSLVAVGFTLVGRVLSKHRSKFTLCSKGGLGGVPGEDGVKRRVIDGRPESVRKSCEESLQRLQTDCVDLLYLHRWDKKVPIEESVGAMGELVRAGKAPQSPV